MKALCGLLKCETCPLREKCGGCAETGGKPFGDTCPIAECCKSGGCENHGQAFAAPCRLKEQLIAEFNALDIPDMEEVKSLNALLGAYVNLSYTLPSGQAIRFWDDNKVYLGNQLHKKGSDRWYGLTADENYLLVCEYGDEGREVYLRQLLYVLYAEGDAAQGVHPQQEYCQVGTQHAQDQDTPFLALE